MRKLNQVAAIPAGDGYPQAEDPEQSTQVDTWRPARSFVELALLLIFPPVIGCVVGLAYGMLEDELALYIKYGFIFGCLGGACLSTVWLLWITGFFKMLLPQPSAPAPTQFETLYTVGTTESIRIVPYKGRGRLIDGVPEKDLIEF